MKKVLCLLFAALFVFASCGKDEPEVLYPYFVGSWMSDDEHPHFLSIDPMDEVSIDESGCYQGLYEVGYYRSREDLESRTNCQMKGFFKKVEEANYDFRLEYYDESLAPTGNYFCFHVYVDKMLSWNEDSPGEKTGYTRVK